MRPLPFALAQGSVTGHSHVVRLRNNQDGVAVHLSEELIVAVVTDGCSSARGSEVGAQLGARWLANWVPKLLAQAPGDAELMEAVRSGLLGYVEGAARGLSPEQELLVASVEEFFLFTYLVAVVQPERCLVFGQGDGVFSVNCKPTVLDPGPENAPAYPSYALVLHAVSPSVGPLQPVLHHTGPTQGLRSLVIATDGAIDLIERAEENLEDGDEQGGLEQFERGPALVKNPSLLQQRLNLIGRVNHRLRDDTTLAVIRRLGQGAL